MALTDCFHRQISTIQGQVQHQDSPKSSHSPYITGLHVLPVELLAHIFTFYHAEAPDKSSLPYPSWLPITLVCRRWRTVALGHGQLWASVTHGLPLHWIKAFMERSGTMLMDFDIHVAPGYRDCLHIVPLLANLTRVRSLCLTGTRNSIPPVIDSLRSSLPVRSLSLCLEDKIVPSRTILILPDILFGRDAPIRHLQLVVVGFNGGHIVTPHWLLRSVTRFMTAGPTLTELLDTLRHMSALVYLEFQSHASCYIAWFTPTVVQVQMPRLMSLVVRTRSPFEFMLLNRLLFCRIRVQRRDWNWGQGMNAHTLMRVGSSAFR